jgi:hypothetical protein
MGFKATRGLSHDDVAGLWRSVAQQVLDADLALMAVGETLDRKLGLAIGWGRISTSEVMRRSRSRRCDASAAITLEQKLEFVPPPEPASAVGEHLDVTGSGLRGADSSGANSF